MTVKEARSRIVTGGLVTMLLLPAQVGLAPSTMAPLSERCSVEQDQTIQLRSGAAPDRAASILLATAGTCPAEAIAVTSSTRRPANTQLAPPAVELPGTVQNLRRTDTH